MTTENDKLDQLGSAWEEFKKANDARLEAIEKKGFAPADYTEKLGKINSDLDSLGKSLAEVQLAAQRPNLGAKGERAEDIEHKQRLTQFLRKGDDTGLRDIERKAMNSTSDPDGGYLVTREMDMAIDRIVPVMSAMSRLARVVNIGSRSWQKRVKKSGMAMTWTTEGNTAGESTEPTYARVEIIVHPGEVEPWVYNETLEDADIDLAADLADEAAIGFAEGEGAAFISGNGVGCPFGITSGTPVANASYAWGSVGYLPSGKSAAFASVAPSDKLLDLQHGLKAQYRPGAVWLMSDGTLGTVRQFKDASGAYYLWQPDTTAGFGGRLLGSPVEVDDNMPAIAANSFSMAYGNFQRAYTIVRRTGTSLIRDNVTAKGTTKFNFRRRLGGGITNYEAFKLMKFATS